MSSEVFWSLGWYDLNLWLDKIRHGFKKVNEEREFTMEMTRQVLCLIANVNRDSKSKPTPFEPQDFMKLSYDKKELKDTRTPEEVKAKFPKTLPKIKQS